MATSAYFYNGGVNAPSRQSINHYEKALYRHHATVQPRKFTTTLYVNDVYILNIGRPINQDSSAIRYALYLLNDEKIILTGATEPGSQVLPLVPFSQTWGLEGIIDLEANTTGEFKSV